jgi:hypothetical protein
VRRRKPIKHKQLSSSTLQKDVISSVSEEFPRQLTDPSLRAAPFRMTGNFLPASSCDCPVLIS